MQGTEINTDSYKYAQKLYIIIFIILVTYMNKSLYVTIKYLSQITSQLAQRFQIGPRD